MSKQTALIGMSIALSELQRQIDRLTLSDSIEGVFMAGYNAAKQGKPMVEAFNDFKQQNGHDGSDESAN